jgi:hypothetical protein
LSCCEWFWQRCVHPIRVYTAASTLVIQPAAHCYIPTVSCWATFQRELCHLAPALCRLVISGCGPDCQFADSEARVYQQRVIPSLGPKQACT